MKQSWRKGWAIVEISAHGRIVTEVFDVYRRKAQAQAALSAFERIVRVEYRFPRKK